MKREGLFRIACCMVAMLAAAPLLAGQAGREEPPIENGASAPIVVTGERLSPAQARQRAAEFVTRTGAANGYTPAARWEEPVCPRVGGLAPAHAALVERWVREIAASRPTGAGRISRSPSPTMGRHVPDMSRSALRGCCGTCAAPAGMPCSPATRRSVGGM